jgi:hypothetical protein
MLPLLPMLPKFPFKTTEEELKLLPGYKEELTKCLEKYLELINSAAKIAEQDQGVFDLFKYFHEDYQDLDTLLNTLKDLNDAVIDYNIK